jgi:hypothetical protein
MVRTIWRSTPRGLANAPWIWITDCSAVVTRTSRLRTSAATAARFATLQADFLSQRLLQMPAKKRSTLACRRSHARQFSRFALWADPIEPTASDRPMTTFVSSSLARELDQKEHGRQPLSSKSMQIMEMIGALHPCSFSRLWVSGSHD